MDPNEWANGFREDVRWFSDAVYSRTLTAKPRIPNGKKKFDLDADPLDLGTMIRPGESVDVIKLSDSDMKELEKIDSAKLAEIKLSFVKAAMSADFAIVYSSAAGRHWETVGPRPKICAR